jgi:hypothetical protein
MIDKLILLEGIIFKIGTVFNHIMMRLNCSIQDIVQAEQT